MKKIMIPVTIIILFLIAACAFIFGSMLKSNETKTSQSYTTLSDLTESSSTQNIKDEILKAKSAIQVSALVVEGPNSAGGVGINIYWKNLADKAIKYITFNVVPYNGVGDIVKCEITDHSAMKCQATGPYYQITSLSQIHSDKNQVYYIYDTTYSEWCLLFPYKEEMLYKITATSKYGSVKDDWMLTYIWNHCYWENLWYNNSIRTAKMTAITIEYMDGTTLQISSDVINQAWNIK